jgi:hypothetical protein
VHGITKSATTKMAAEVFMVVITVKFISLGARLSLPGGVK